MSEASESSLFEGNSESGDLTEALDNAISNAKAGLQTTLVDWKFVSLGGSHGGFVQTKKIKVVISAWLPTGSEE